MPRIELSGCTLVRDPYDPWYVDPADRDPDDDGELDWEYEPEPHEIFIEDTHIDIHDQRGVKIGAIRVFLVDRAAIAVSQFSFSELMDEHSQEACEFAESVFDSRGRLRSDVRQQGTRIWGKELDRDATVAYLHEICVERRYRNQGAGKWAIKKLMNECDRYLNGARYLYTFPCALNSEWADGYEPRPSQATRHAMRAATVRLKRFYRQQMLTAS
ncbi:hypothetical protein JCM10908_000708 [Rhodotorula pacifica]|uniref:GNAT family N-acetyltransferase n=1 Tax=Rhodotorula pacifica TaxID=1495444 RepID=UPI00316FE001